MLDGLSAAAPLEIEANSVPLLAVHGDSETWGQPQKVGQSEACQAEYQQVGRAATYDLQFQRTLLKRSSTCREYSLIDRHIRRVAHTRVVLDMPCGDGLREAGVNP